jgi:hypothetical protein
MRSLLCTDCTVLLLAAQQQNDPLSDETEATVA